MVTSSKAHRFFLGSIAEQRDNAPALVAGTIHRTGVRDHASQEKPAYRGPRGPRSPEIRPTQELQLLRIGLADWSEFRLP